jgi:heme exporter protein A
MYRIADLDERIDGLLHRVDLYAQRMRPVRTYSRGQTQRLAVARALLHDPDLLLMDEPYTGLDQRAADMLDRTILDSCANGRAVLLTTHDLEHGWQLGQRSEPARATHIAFLIDGQIGLSVPAREISPNDLRQAYTRQLGSASPGRD